MVGTQFLQLELMAIFKSHCHNLRIALFIQKFIKQNKNLPCVLLKPKSLQFDVKLRHDCLNKMDVKSKTCHIESKKFLKEPTVTIAASWLTTYCKKSIVDEKSIISLINRQSATTYKKLVYFIEFPIEMIFQKIIFSMHIPKN